jgi:hypothetical protein
MAFVNLFGLTNWYSSFSSSLLCCGVHWAIWCLYLLLRSGGWWLWMCGVI